MTKHTGSSHCGKVRFEVEADLRTASRCNCSICTKTSATGVVAKPSAFQLLTPEGALGQYAFGGRTATRFFCSACGIHCFLRGHLEQLGGDYVSVNVNCLDGVDPAKLDLVYWDGRHDNWQAGPRKSPWPVAAG